MSAPDPLRQIQAAARLVAGWVAPGATAARVVVLDASGKELFAAFVPPGSFELVERANETPETVAGWSFSDRAAKFDGKLVPVSSSRLKLLRALVEAETPLTAKELTDTVFDKHTDLQNTRFHLRELRKELKSAFADFEGECIVSDGDGHRLVLR